MPVSGPRAPGPAWVAARNAASSTGPAAPSPHATSRADRTCPRILGFPEDHRIESRRDGEQVPDRGRVGELIQVTRQLRRGQRSERREQIEESARREGCGVDGAVQLSAIAGGENRDFRQSCALATTESLGGGQPAALRLDPERQRVLARKRTRCGG